MFKKSFEYKFRKIILFIVLFSTFTLSSCAQINKTTGNENSVIESWSGYLNRNPVYVEIDEGFPTNISDQIEESIEDFDQAVDGITLTTDSNYKNELRIISIIKDLDYEHTGSASVKMGEDIPVAKAITSSVKNSFGGLYVTTYILNSTIYVHPNFHKVGPVRSIIIHEIIHSFGFGHSDDPENIMWHEVNCNWLTQQDIDMLNEEYPE